MDINYQLSSLSKHTQIIVQTKRYRVPEHIARIARMLARIVVTKIDDGPNDFDTSWKRLESIFSNSSKTSNKVFQSN